MFRIQYKVNHKSIEFVPKRNEVATCKNTESTNENAHSAIKSHVNPPSVLRLPANSLMKSPDINFENENNGHYVAKVLNNIRVKSLNNVVIGILNINSLGGKFDRFKFIISGKMHIMVIVETNLDETYPDAQFYIKDYSKPVRYMTETGLVVGF